MGMRSIRNSSDKHFYLCKACYFTRYQFAKANRSLLLAKHEHAQRVCSIHRRLASFGGIGDRSQSYIKTKTQIYIFVFWSLNFFFYKTVLDSNQLIKPYQTFFRDIV